MAVTDSTTLVKLGELHEPEDGESKVLTRLKQLAKETLPPGWENWEIVDDRSKDSDLAVPKNKLRYALPTVGMAKAFDPSIVHISEKAYTEMKIQMFRWPFCRGLIISPSELSVKIRGSVSRHRTVIQSTALSKHLFCSRNDANIQLEVAGAYLPAPSGTKRKAMASSTARSYGKRRSNNYQLEARMDRLEATLQRFIQSQQSTPDSPVSSRLLTSQDEESLNEFPDEEKSTADAKLADMSCSVQSKNRPKEDEDKKQGIRDPEVDIERQGKTCQRLGTPGWNKIRYGDSQRKLQAGGMFQALQVNPQIKTAASNSMDLLTQMDSSFGILTHGLLLQQKCFGEAMTTLISQNEEVAIQAMDLFSGKDSEYRSMTDSLLQFVCGKRAEVIEARRKFLEPKDQKAAQLMRDIPPSDKSLFSEELLQESFLQSQLSSSNEIPSSRHPQSSIIAISPETIKTEDSADSAPMKHSPNAAYISGDQNELTRGHKVPLKGFRGFP